MVLSQKHDHSQSEQQSVELPPGVSDPLTPSTTEESFPAPCSSGEALLHSSGSTQATQVVNSPEDEFKHNGQLVCKIPGVVPLSGHTGWL